MRSGIQTICCYVILAALGITGCNSGGAAEQTEPIELSGPPPTLAREYDHRHAHGNPGPHGGHLIELGRNHQYHAEFVVNESLESVTVHILDAHLKELPINARSILLSLTTGGQTEAYEMVAAGDGQSTNASRFEPTDQALFRVLNQHGEISGRLRVTIDGVPYVGRLAHHDHAHEHCTHHHR